jgi:hypothetical protein
LGLLATIDWPEPFGLVMIEALACGTPVIAFNRGSVPEIVEHGLTGFIVEDEAGAVSAVDGISQLSRQTIRERFEHRFTARRMAQDYLAVYRDLMEAAEPLPRLVARLRAVRDSFGLARPTAATQSALGRVSGNSSQTRPKPPAASDARLRKAAVLPK